MTTNILQFSINESGHAIIRYVTEDGTRVSFDLTQHIEETVLHGHAIPPVQTADAPVPLNGDS